MPGKDFNETKIHYKYKLICPVLIITPERNEIMEINRFFDILFAGSPMHFLHSGRGRVLQELDGEGRDDGLDSERVQRHVGHGQGRYSVLS